tara:strand:- start:2215 stop:2592 length:378 start_codon:yes stop_codon:yes gene_type:complete
MMTDKDYCIKWFKSKNVEAYSSLENQDDVYIVLNNIEVVISPSEVSYRAELYKSTLKPTDYLFSTETLDVFVQMIEEDKCPYDAMVKFIEMDIEHDGQQEKMALLFALTKQVYHRNAKLLINQIL